MKTWIILALLLVPAPVIAAPVHGEFRCEWVIEAFDGQNWREKSRSLGKAPLIIDDELSLVAYGPELKHDGHFIQMEYRHTQMGTGTRKYEGQVQASWGLTNARWGTSLHSRLHFGEVMSFTFPSATDPSARYSAYCSYDGTLRPKE